MARATVKGVLREMHKARRRKGGMRRMRMELMLARAWDLGWLDEFRADPIEYVAQAEAAMLQQEKELRELRWRGQKNVGE